MLALTLALVLAAATVARPHNPPDQDNRGVTLDFTRNVIDPDMAGDCKMAGDIDGDGLVDAAIGGTPGEDLRWYRWPDWAMTEIGSARVEFTTDGALGDVDGDGDLDVVIGDGPTGDNLFWFRNPLPEGDPLDGAQWARLTVGGLGHWCKDIRLADYDLDGRLDIACRADFAAFIFFQNSGGTWQRITLEPGLTGEGMGSGDVDGDGDTDLVIRGNWHENPAPAASPRTAVWNAWNIAAKDYELKMVVADIDGRPGMEVIYSNSEGTGPVTWYTPTLGDPTGDWTGTNIFDSLPGCHTLQAGDVDRNGTVDLLLAQMHTTTGQRILVMLNNGGARSWTQVEVDNTGLHNGVLIDFGGDGDLDIYGANWTGHPPLRLYENTLGAACPADFDGSGSVDSNDISAFLTRWLTSIQEGTLDADFDGSGEVNSNDISALLSAWLDAVQNGC